MLHAEQTKEEANMATIHGLERMRDIVEGRDRNDLDEESEGTIQETAVETLKTLRTIIARRGSDNSTPIAQLNSFPGSTHQLKFLETTNRMHFDGTSSCNVSTPSKTTGLGVGVDISASPSSALLEPILKKARRDNDIPLIMNNVLENTTLSPSVNPVTEALRKKGSRRKSKLILPPWQGKEFSKRFSSLESYSTYLTGPPDSLHAISYNKHAPLSGVRAFFVTEEKYLSKAMAINMDNIARLGGMVQGTFIPSSSRAVPDYTTTHIIVASASLRFKDVLKLLHLTDEAELVGSRAAAGVLGAKPKVWVVKIAWLHKCCAYANDPRSIKVKKLSEIPWLVEAEGDKKRRKGQLICQKSFVSDPAWDDFNVPEESSTSTSVALSPFRISYFPIMTHLLCH